MTKEIIGDMQQRMSKSEALDIIETETAYYALVDVVSAKLSIGQPVILPEIGRFYVRQGRVAFQPEERLARLVRGVAE